MLRITLCSPGRTAAATVFAIAVLSGVPVSAAAQDVEMLGRYYGTPVPEGFLRARAEDPTAFRFRRGWGRRGVDRLLLERRGAGTPGPQLALGPRSGPVQGTFEVPVVLGLFSNSGASAPFTRAAIDNAYFSASTGTITDFYDEISGGRVELLGDVLDWVQAPRPDTVYTAGESGIDPSIPAPGGAWQFVWDLLELHGSVDWGRYDNDGPDGVPNSGDDDGFVDVLSVIQPSSGAECGGPGSGDRIWSHRWSLSAPFGQPFTTTTPRTGAPGFIRIDDYTIQPAIGCGGSGIAEIGVFAHELGHAFGLPDLYDTDGGHSGAGEWDLMASGSWGCSGSTPEEPCEMGAWSKAALGWVEVVEVPPGTDLGDVRLPPVETTDTVYRVEAADGSGEYFLLENRQRLGYDTQLHEEGLLVWRIDPAVVSAQWASNRVNAGAHMGVYLVQADDRDDLGLGHDRGDRSDPFPGGSNNRAFHAVSAPSSASHAGGISGLTITDIAPSGDDMTFRLSTRFTEVTVRTEGASVPDGLLTVNGEAVAASHVLVSAPFLKHELEAAVGEAVGPGVRRGFDGWTDDPSETRTRTIETPLVDTAFVAQYGTMELELSMTLTGGVAGVEPATFLSEPVSEDLWFPEGAAVSLTAVPKTGFTFDGWSGVLAGQPNPALFTMDAPSEAGADFTLVYAVVEATVELPAATDLDVQLEIDQGTAPVQWRVVEGELPPGVQLSGSGRLTGAALEMGRFDLTVEAVDALGLPATGAVTLDMTAPAIALERLTAPFLLTGEPLDAVQISFLSRQGNASPGYDVGDFRKWVLSDPALPLAADLGELVVRGTIRLRAPTTEGGR